MDFGNCACSGKSLMRLLRPAVLHVLAGEPTHGYLVGQRLAELAMFRDQPADLTGLYRLLKDMEKEHLVTSAWDTGDSGPARRRYQITERGRQCLARWTQTLDRYHQTVADLLRWMKKGE
jgi:DNA-binding PadR family transcriptional regulator